MDYWPRLCMRWDEMVDEMVSEMVRSFLFLILPQDWIPKEPQMENPSKNLLRDGKMVDELLIIWERFIMILMWIFDWIKNDE